MQFPVTSAPSQIEDLKILSIYVSVIFLSVQPGRVIKRNVSDDVILAKLRDIERILGE